MRLFLTVALLIGVQATVLTAAVGVFLLADVHMAHAQDDDDGDDDSGGDDDDDDGGSTGGSGGSTGGGSTGGGSTGGGDDDDDDTPAPRSTTNTDDDDTTRPTPRRDDTPAPRTRQRTQTPPPPPPVVVPQPTRAAREIVALDLSDDDLALLITRGYRVIETRTVPRLGTTSRRLRAPQGTALEDARAEVRALASGDDADFNHFYRTEEDIIPASAPAATPSAPVTTAPCDGAHCRAFEQISWPLGAAQCATPVTIGIVDTGVNPDHTTFADAKLDVIRMTGARQDPSRAIHGTAVAAILVGDPDSRSPGLVPQMPVVAVDIFHRRAGDERADVFSLIEAIGLLADRGARVVNLSLAGPPNTVLEKAIARLADESGIIFVAAAGNGGPRAKPAYPAAYADVIAVTAIDRDNTIYRRAGQGDHITLAAPGVDVWTAASISGARPKTGTSFAAPYVTAVVARILQHLPDATPQDMRSLLAATALDLGDAAFDPVYGHGLVQLPDLPPCLKVE